MEIDTAIKNRSNPDSDIRKEAQHVIKDHNNGIHDFNTAMLLIDMEYINKRLRYGLYKPIKTPID